MGNIVLLDDLTINKIAAGEVIERPASVIKEMVENSIDAGANNITVEIKNGGISYIRVTDNGKGIAEDDLEIAFERHATSKIRSADDLNTVTSMGFRGEALASIAAIAKVEMISKTANQENGYKVVVEGGNVLDKSEAGCPVGTTITVTNLFYNTPVRYKFLKKDFTEAGYIEDVVTRIALVHPEIAIKLINTGRTVIQTNGNGDLKTVIYSIYGRDVAGALIETEYDYEGIHVFGVVGKPEIARSNRANQIFFVNKRYVKDKALSSAAERAFKGMIPMGKFSFLVLNVDMNPNKVDVNVHPAKLEVRFEEENIVFKAVYHAIKDALLKGEVDKYKQHNSNPKKIENTLFNSKNETKGETIVEQIYKARQQSQNQNEDEIIDPEPAIYRREAFKEKVQEEPVVKQNENLKTETTSNLGMSELEKSQEVLRKLQEIKDKLIQESPELREKLEQKQSFTIETNEEKEPSFEIKDEEKQEPSFEIKDEEKQEPSFEIEQQKKQEKIEEISYENEADEKIYEVAEEEIPYALRNMEKEKVMPDPKVDLLEEIAKAGQRQLNLKDEVSKALDKTSEINNRTINIEKQKEEKKEKHEEQPELLNKSVDKKEDEIEYSKEFEEMYLKLFGTKPVKGHNLPEETKQEEKEDIEDIATLGNTSIFNDLEEYQKPTYKFIGIVFDTYIILEIDKEMYIIDQHSANERILYERIRANYYDDENKDSQLMLLPDIITLTHKEMQIARDNMEMFRKAGFTLEEFGDNTIKLTGVPEMCLDLETKEMFLEILGEINSISRNAKQEVEECFLSAVASRVADKVKKVFSKEEIDNLMDKLLSLQNPFTSARGRAIAIKMSKYDIERKFARK